MNSIFKPIIFGLVPALAISIFIHARATGTPETPRPDPLSENKWHEIVLDFEGYVPASELTGGPIRSEELKERIKAVGVTEGQFRACALRLTREVAKLHVTVEKNEAVNAFVEGVGEVVSHIEKPPSDVEARMARDEQLTASRLLESRGKNVRPRAEK